MFSLSEKVKQRRILVKPCFEDFDRQAATCVANVLGYMYVTHSACMCVPWNSIGMAQT